MAEYNVVIVGDRGVGKSAFLQKLLTGEFEPNHIPTDPGSQTRLVFHTNHGDIAFNVLESTITSYITGDTMNYVDAMIGFYSTLTSYLSLPKWYHIVRLKNPRIPLVACGNGCDLSSEQKQLLSEQWHQHYDVNVKSGYNCEEPFLYLVRRLTGYNDLVFLKETPDHRVWDATDINRSVQRCTELFLEADLLPLSWVIIITHCLSFALSFAIQVAETIECLDREFKADTVFIPFTLHYYRQAINHILLPILGVTEDPYGTYEYSKALYDQCANNSDPLQSYTAMKCKVLDSLNMELCLLVNQYVIDNNLSMVFISEEIIMDNIHNPFMNQYDYLYGGTYARTDDQRTDPRKRKPVEQAEHGSDKKSCAEFSEQDNAEDLPDVDTLIQNTTQIIRESGLTPIGWYLLHYAAWHTAYNVACDVADDVAGEAGMEAAWLAGGSSTWWKSTRGLLEIGSFYGDDVLLFFRAVAAAYITDTDVTYLHKSLLDLTDLVEIGEHANTIAERLMLSKIDKELCMKIQSIVRTHDLEDVSLAIPDNLINPWFRQYRELYLAP